jgi:hypothetical protein
MLKFLCRCDASSSSTMAPESSRQRRNGECGSGRSSPRPARRRPRNARSACWQSSRVCPRRTGRRRGASLAACAASTYEEGREGVPPRRRAAASRGGRSRRTRPGGRARGLLRRRPLLLSRCGAGTSPSRAARRRLAGLAAPHPRVFRRRKDGLAPVMDSRRPGELGLEVGAAAYPQSSSASATAGAGVWPRDWEEKGMERKFCHSRSNFFPYCI